MKKPWERYRVHKFLHIHTYTHTYIHTYTHTHIHTYIHTDISPIIIFLSSWDPKTPKTIKNSRADFYAKNPANFSVRNVRKLRNVDFGFLTPPFVTQNPTNVLCSVRFCNKFQNTPSHSMWCRNFPPSAFSDTRTEIISNRV